MAIRVNNVSIQNVTPERLLRMVSGKKDEYGNPFRLITLIWGHPGAHPFKMGGFDDAEISFLDGQRVPQIIYQHEGNASFEPDEFIPNQLVARVPKTPRNMNVLAHTFKDDKFFIEEDDVREEAKKMSDKIPQTEKDVQRRKDMKRSRWDRDPYPQQVDKPASRETLELRKDLRRSEDPDVDVAGTGVVDEGSDVAELAEDEVKITVPEREDLEKQEKYPFKRLQFIAKRLGVYPDKTKVPPTRANVIEAIVNARHEQVNKTEEAVDSQEG